VTPVVVSAILVSIGANLPASDDAPPLETCRRALIALDAWAGLRLRGLSRWYRTDPVPVADAPSFINAVADFRVEAGATILPEVLLARLMEIERAAGRVRTVPNAPRPLDLDIIAMGNLVRTSPDPILPHPRAHERGFVLIPLAEVAPHWVHPLLSRTVQELIAALPSQGLEPL
jgi:2-amino-4-hydroxy-6-hydroxymethyldihydropteridine diphosphokinase